jgi:hypothetical protein
MGCVLRVCPGRDRSATAPQPAAATRRRSDRRNSAGHRHGPDRCTRADRFSLFAHVFPADSVLGERGAVPGTHGSWRTCQGFGRPSRPWGRPSPLSPLPTAPVGAPLKDRQRPKPPKRRAQLSVIPAVLRITSASSGHQLAGKGRPATTIGARGRGPRVCALRPCTLDLPCFTERCTGFSKFCLPSAFQEVGSRGVVPWGCRLSGVCPGWDRPATVAHSSR